MAQDSAKKPTAIRTKTKSAIIFLPVVNHCHLMSVPRAEPLQAFLGGAPPTLARSDYEHAVRPQRLEQRILRIAREVDHDLLGPDTAGHLPGLLQKDAQGNLRMPQIERKRYALHSQDADYGRYHGGDVLSFLQAEPGELASGVS